MIINTSSTDEYIVSLASQGDQNAWVTILSRYLPLIKNRAAVYVGADFEGEDLAQEGYIGFIRAVRTYSVDAGSSFKTYAILCIDNSIISAVRKSLTKKCIPGSVLVPLDDCTSLPEETSAEEEYFSKESIRFLKERLSSKLSKFEFDVFSLYLIGYSIERISKELKVQKKSINNAIFRIKRKLRDLG